jgi:hypothetical protein
VGQTSIGYGDNDDNTTLTDMQNSYSSIYLRNRFVVSNAAGVEQLRLRVYVDDGCVIWINGKEVFRLYVDDGFLPYNALASTTIGDAAWEEFSLPAPYDYLVNGLNVITIQALNAALSSSDLSIDVELIADAVVGGPTSGGPTSGGATSGDTTEVAPPAYPAVKGWYEIDPVWESAEITSFNSGVTIPASAVEPGAAYRVRCRMKDKTGRWSHWSDPVQFVAGI